jgi:hypothetical protein
MLAGYRRRHAKPVGRRGRHDPGVPPQMCLADPYASAVNPHDPAASTLEMVRMPITYLIGKTGIIEGYVTGAADWLSPEGTALLDYYRDQGGRMSSTAPTSRVT